MHFSVFLSSCSSSNYLPFTVHISVKCHFIMYSFLVSSHELDNIPLTHVSIKYVLLFFANLFSFYNYLSVFINMSVEVTSVISISQHRTLQSRYITNIDCVYIHILLSPRSSCLIGYSTQELMLYFSKNYHGVVNLERRC